MLKGMVEGGKRALEQDAEISELPLESLSIIEGDGGRGF